MEYRLIRSRRKTMALQVTRESAVVVRAPLRLAKREIDRFVEAHLPWVEKQLARQERYRQQFPEPTPAELAALRQKAKEIIPGKVAHYAAVMGLVPQGVRITQARTRFGSCSPKNALSFSCLLLRHPPEAVDYVVVHELAHIVHKNHGRGFYALIETILPDYRRRKELLKPPRG